MDKKLLEWFNIETIEEQCRQHLTSFMLYTDPYANSPDWAYTIKEFHRKIIDVLEKVERWEIKKLMINVPAQHGKQIGSSELVLTNLWWKTHWDLHRWDFVFNEKWEQVMVLWESTETQSEYRITFSNGQTIDCHWNHEWVLSKNKHDFNVFETKELYKDNLIRIEWKNRRRIYRLPSIQPLQFIDKDLTIDPYTLWFWLWDWKTNSWAICSPKEELNSVIEKICSCWNKIWKIRSHTDYDLDSCTILWLQTKLKDLGILWNKYIPQDYLYGSINQRLELLAWLIDSDWAVFNDKRWKNWSRVTFTNTNKDIIDWVQFLCDSFWWKTYNFKCLPKPHDNVHPNKICYQISFNPTLEIPSALKRKQIVIWNTKRLIWIDKIEKIEWLEMWKCIEVEGWLYLVGKKLIPTHNSSLSSVGYTSRTLGRNPYQHIGLISYSSSLSESFSRKTREMLRSKAYQKIFWDILSPDSQSVENWNTKVGWSFCAVWVWGSYTGKPATKIIIDDPHKDQAEAQSPLIRQNIWDWYTSVPTTRITSLTSVIIIMTRRHEDDLCWRLLAAEPDERTVLNIPVFNEDWSVIRPERHPKEMIEKKRLLQWESMFQAMYMWDPINEWGWGFKNEYFQYYEKWEIFDEYWVNYKKTLYVTTFIDPAISQKQTADDTSIVTVWLDRENNNVYVLDIRRWKRLPDETINNVFSVVNQFKPNKVWIESNAFQKMLEMEIRKEMRKRDTFFNLEGQPSTMNKEAKILSALQPRYSNCSILHQKRWPNVNELESQLLKFPNGKHDDICDAESMAVMMLSSMNVNSKNKVVKADWLWWNKRIKKNTRILTQ